MRGEIIGISKEDRLFALYRKVLGCIFCAAFLCSVVQSFFLNLGTTAPAVALTAAAALLAFRWKRFKTWFCAFRAHHAGRTFSNGALAVILAAALLFVLLSGLMISAMNKKPPVRGMTLIVLGCQVRGETPSLMLARRLETAAAYLNSNPGAYCILSGGQGRGEAISEAECMRRYLTAEGIAEDRLLLEERSTSTLENILFSKDILEARNLPETVVIATDGFHQFRAQRFAKHAQLTAYAVSSRTPYRVLPYFWIREVLAIAASFLPQSQ